MLTARLVEQGRRVCFGELPADVVRVAKHCVLDWLGVTLAGSREPLCSMVLESLCGDEHGGEATLLGFGRRASVRSAALVNGTAAHALDYDDTHWGLQGHPTAPVLSALFGLAEQRHASGPQLLAALVSGIEVECLLGRWLNPGHYARGYHATATLGTFGAAAAAAHLLELPEPVWRNAFGLAGTMAAGLKSAFGTDAKPLQVGRAAEAGLSAALLAAAGCSANPNILDDPQGFVVTHADAVTERAAEVWSIRRTLFKYHAACYLTHASIDALRTLQAEHAFTAQDVQQVHLTVDETCLHVCNIENPRTGQEAKFSLRATAAMALLGLATDDPRTFDDATLQAPALRALLERVVVATAPLPATASIVHVQLRDGRTLSLEHDAGIPDSDLARQEHRLCEKLARLLPLPAAEPHELRHAALNLERIPAVRSLAEAARAHAIR